jgi:hypothetical protein
MKKLLIIVLLILGIYMLFFHYAPFPLNHEQFGLYNHTIHMAIGVILLSAAGFLWWKGRRKNSHFAEAPRDKQE